MTRPLRIEYPGAFYHITSRGNERKNIFKDDGDRQKFLSYLESSVARYGAVIHVYCLMDNHYHLLLETPYGNLSQIMRHINGAYTTYFNTRHKRSGHLLQGRYKAIVVEVDEYAEELSRYIHLNPARAGIVERLEEYQWSSYQQYIGKRKAADWLEVRYILGYFGKREKTARKKYEAFVNDLLDQNYESPLKDAVASTLLGSSDFVNRIRDKYLNDKEPDRNLPVLGRLINKPSVDDICSEVRTVFEEDASLCRKVSIYLCHAYTGRRLKEVSNYFGISESGVIQPSRRLKEKPGRDRKLRKRVERIIKQLNL